MKEHVLRCDVVYQEVVTCSVFALSSIEYILRTDAVCKKSAGLKKSGNSQLLSLRATPRPLFLGHPSSGKTKRSSHLS
jgi:hypothetical protein